MENSAQFRQVSRLFSIKAIILFLLAISVFAFSIFTIVKYLISSGRTMSAGEVKENLAVSPEMLGQVKGISSVFDVNIEGIFNKPLSFKDQTQFERQARFLGGLVTQNADADFGTGNITAGNVTAENLIYRLNAGTGVLISGGQTPTISLSDPNGGVQSLQGKKGALKLIAGTGISISGMTISNDDPGTSQSIFKNMSVAGQPTVTADANDDTLTFVSGTGITITTNATGKSLTFSSTATNESGWVQSGTNVLLGNIASLVGIGTTNPQSMLSVGALSQFQVDSNGNIIRVNNIPTLFPSVQGSANSFLMNDGNGSLSWNDATGSGAFGYLQRYSTTLSPTNFADSLGIGTTAAQDRLHVVGNARIDGVLKLTPTQLGKVLEAGDAADNDAFGNGVAISADGSVLVVGASNWEGSAGTDRGGVYTYDWNGHSWVQRGRVLQAIDAANSDSFGVSLSISADGTVLAVGAFLWEGAVGSNRGGVYIYDWNGSSWVQRGSVLEAADASNGDIFGRGVALSSSGSVLAVSARAWEGATGTDRGGIYIYDWNGSAWIQRGNVLEAADAADSDYMSAVALSSDGNILAVGASGWEGTVGIDRGGVYIYDWTGSSWVQRGRVIEETLSVDSDYFGSAVALSGDGDILAISALSSSGTPSSLQGYVYLYDWNGVSWIQRGSVLIAADGVAGDIFGNTVSLSSDGSLLIVGANSWVGTTGTNRGGVYTYALTANATPFSTTSNGTGWNSFFTNTITANTGGAERLRIDSAGNIGIGTTNPTATFYISGTTNQTQLVIRAASTQSNTNPLFLLVGSDGTNIGAISSDYRTNVFMGLNAGLNNAVNAPGFQGIDNTFIGYQAGKANTTGWGNTALGEDALGSSVNSALNTAIGKLSLYSMVSGGMNTVLGRQAMYYNANGWNNTALGTDAGMNLKTGSYNTIIGDQALYSNTGASNNTVIGRRAGYSNINGGGNIFLGYNAGYNETGSNKLYIENSSSSTPLIFGDFSSDIVGINGQVGIGTTNPVEKLHVSGGNITLDTGYRLSFRGGDPSFSILYSAYNAGGNIVTGGQHIFQGYAGPTDGWLFTTNIADKTTSVFEINAGTKQAYFGGNVGIGATGAIEKLQVNGNARIDGILKLKPTQISKVLEAADAADTDWFGWAVSLSADGSVMAVGAPYWEGAAGSNRGGVYIFDWNGTSWVQRGNILEAADASNTDLFGMSVSLSSNGSILAVGAAFWEGAAGADRGGVYIFDWTGTTWVQRGSVIEAADAADTDAFGRSVSLSASGTILSVGAYLWEGAAGSGRGGVYIYDWSGAAWVQRGSVLEAADGVDNDAFGESVALSSTGATIAVGAYARQGVGGVYIYDWSGAAWVQRGNVLTASDAFGSDYFGQAVALTSDASTLAVGAFRWEGSTGTDRGGVYLYDWNGSSWVQRSSVIETSDAADSDFFGTSVAISANGGILTSGAYSWEGVSGSNRGGVYTYSLTANALPLSTTSNGTGWNSFLTNILAANTSGVERMRIDSNGNVGIGTTLPQATLDINGTLRLGGETIGDIIGQGLILSGTAVSIDTVTTGTTSTTASNSGLEVTTDGVRLLGGCSANQVLAWDAGANRWQCTTSSGGVSGNGVAGRISFWTSASALASTQNLYWDDTNLRLGVATSTPLSSLSINGNASIGSFAGVATAPINGLIISGNVGIGSTNAGTRLDIDGTLRLNNNLYLNSGVANLSNREDVLAVNKYLSADTNPVWTTGASGGTSRNFFSSNALVQNGKIYYWAGNPANTTFDIYDIPSNTWSVGTPGGTARYAQAGVIYNNKIYYWGGDNGGAMNTMYIYDIPSNSWSSGATGGTARFYHTAVVYEGKIYYWGGWNGTTRYNTVDIYNIATNTWSTGVAGGTARFGHTAVLYNGKIYFWGGSTASGMTNTIDIYDIVSGSWTTATAGGTARFEHSSVLYNGKIYHFNGNDGVSMVTAVNIYDIASDSWSNGVSGGGSRAGVSAALYNGKVYVWGSTTTMSIYDLGYRQNIFSLQENGQDTLSFLTNSTLFLNSGRFNILGGNVGIGTTTPGSKLHVVGGDIYAAAGSGYTFNNASALADIYAQGNLEVDGTIFGTTASLGQINIAGDIIGDFTGQGLITSGTAVTIDTVTTGTTSTTASNSGLEVTAAGVRMLGGCSANQVLAWDAGAARWQCTTSSGGASGNGVNGRIAFWNGAASIASDTNLYWDFANKRLGIGTSSPMNNLDVNGNMVIGAYAGTFTAPLNGLLVSGRVGFGTTAPAYAFDLYGVGRMTNLLTQELQLGGANTSIFSAHKGFGGFTNVLGGIGTGGTNSLISQQRITTEGNLVNIGSIQAGEMNLSRGGTFGVRTDYSGVGGSFSYNSGDSGDINGDGYIDIVVPVSFSNVLNTMINNGDGTFVAGSSATLNANAKNARLVDMNGDGSLDVVVGSYTGSTISVLINRGNGTFIPRVDYSVGADGLMEITTNDFNGDAKLDVAAVNQSDAVMYIFTNNGNGTLTYRASYAAGTMPSHITSGDFNGDGAADIAVATFDNSNKSISVLLNKGDGTFNPRTAYLGSSYMDNIAAADLNEDNKDDIVVANASGNNLSVFLNTGSGTFPTRTEYTTGTTPLSVGLGDVNGDGKADIITSNFDSSNISVLTNNGNGTFATHVDYASYTIPSQVMLGDYNRDGKIDVALTHYSSDYLSVFINQSSSMLYAQASTGFVGLGMTNPSVALDVMGDIEYTGTITDVSDARLKENIVPVSDALQTITALKGYSFNMIGSTEPELGFLAQDVKQVLPEAVKIVDPVKGYLGVNYMAFIPVLSEAIKEEHQNYVELLDKVNYVENMMVQQSSVSMSTNGTTSLTNVLSDNTNSLLENVLLVLDSLKLNVEDKALHVSTDLAVTGNTTLNDLNVTGDLVAGMIKINTLDNSLDVLGTSCYNPETENKNMSLCEDQSLYVQKSLAGNVNIFNGAIVLEPDGIATFKGKVSAPEMSTDVIKASEYSVTKDSQALGGGVLKAGTKSVKINSSLVSEDSRIFVTTTSSSNGQNLIVKNKKSGESFEVYVDESISEDITFDWWIVTVR